MTVREWLAHRTPVPPPALRARLDEALGESDAAADDVAEACLRTAERLIETLLRGECTSRESALDLLTADALVTYAFEAAGASPGDLVSRASGAMRRIAALGGGRPAVATAE
jgi:hypothetical protein